MRLRKTALVTVLIIAIGTLVFGYVRFHQPLLPIHGKGGVGVVGDGNYVLTNGEFNEVICGSTKWKGLARSEREVVTCKNSTVMQFGFADLFKNSFIIHFTSARIYIYDLNAYSGGYYLRFSE